MIDYKVRFNDIPWHTVAPGAREKLCAQGDTRLRLIEFREGLQHPEWCLRGHMAIVLEGRLELRFDGQTLNYDEGDALFIPEGEAHRHIPRPLSARVLLFSVEANPAASGG